MLPLDGISIGHQEVGFTAGSFGFSPPSPIRVLSLISGPEREDIPRINKLLLQSRPSSPDGGGGRAEGDSSSICMHRNRQGARICGCNEGNASILRAMHLHSAIFFLAVSVSAVAQTAASASAVWQMQASGTTAGLRGIDSIDGRVAWASGTGGTVLRTIDGGTHWLKCAVPDAATDGATLDFRGIQARDAQTAIVMASGPGAKSRLYKTTDGCQTWTLLLKNPDAPNGFFDSFWFNGPRGILLGDPVADQFVVLLTDNGGKTWIRDQHPGLALHGRSLSAFAASNRCIAIGNSLFTRGFATGGKGGSIFFSRPFTAGEDRHGIVDRLVRKEPPWKSSSIPIGSATENSGTFSVAYRYPVTVGICQDCGFDENSLFVAVGGDFTKPNDSDRTAAWSSDGGWTWTVSATPPHGYRSSVQWSETLKAWIAAGTNGSDISRNDGKTWQPLDDGDWNALSLPFAVGLNGRIARINPRAISPASMARGAKGSAPSPTLAAPFAQN